MVKLLFAPAEIQALADRVGEAFRKESLEPHEDTWPEWSDEELLAEVRQAVTVALGLDQVGQDYDLLIEAATALGEPRGDVNLSDPPPH